MIRLRFNLPLVGQRRSLARHRVHDFVLTVSPFASCWASTRTFSNPYVKHKTAQHRDSHITRYLCADARPRTDVQRKKSKRGATVGKGRKSATHPHAPLREACPITLEAGCHPAKSNGGRARRLQGPENVPKLGSFNCFLLHDSWVRSDFGDF
jgi:hypothetical protein